MHGAASTVFLMLKRSGLISASCLSYVCCWTNSPRFNLIFLHDMRRNILRVVNVFVLLRSSLLAWITLMIRFWFKSSTSQDFHAAPIFPILPAFGSTPPPRSVSTTYTIPGLQHTKQQPKRRAITEQKVLATPGIEPGSGRELFPIQ
jgi:hypothetical protein